MSNDIIVFGEGENILCVVSTEHANPDCALVMALVHAELTKIMPDFDASNFALVSRASGTVIPLEQRVSDLEVGIISLKDRPLLRESLYARPTDHRATAASDATQKRELDHSEEFWIPPHMMPVSDGIVVYHAGNIITCKGNIPDGLMCCEIFRMLGIDQWKHRLHNGNHYLPHNLCRIPYGTRLVCVTF